jgi:hypothetical protein
VLVALAALWPGLALARHPTGFQVKVGKFSVLVAYDLADRPDTAVRDPRRGLFAVAALLQANAAAVAEVPLALELWVSADREGKGPAKLEVLEARDSKPLETVSFSPPQGSVESQLVAAICARAPGACTRPPAETLELFRCTKGTPCPGQIELGAIPSESSDKRFGLLPPKGSRAKPLRVRREQMTQHFRVLEAR